jgi:diguanylate cyclase (GGDEF)-like protein
MLNVEEKIEQIQRTELFSSLSSPELGSIGEKCREEFHPAGRVIFQESEAGSTLYIVTKGEVHISKGGVVIAEAREGDVFGEMALLDEGSRSASAVAAEDVHVLCIERDDFLKTSSGNWEVTRKIFKALSGIIRRQSDRYLHQVLEQQQAVRRMEYALQLNRYMEIGKALTSTLNVRHVLSILLDRVSQTIRARGMLVFMIDRPHNELFLRDSKGFGLGQLGNFRIPLGQRLCELVCKRMTSVVVEDILSSEARKTLPPRILELIRKSALFVPLKIGEKAVGFLGAVDVEDIHLFREEHRPFLEILADYVAVALANATNYETIDHLSITDDVTGFYNTRFLHRHLDHLLDLAARKDKAVSLVFFDLDNFKKTVDAHGHLLGSKVLKEVAAFVSRYLGEEDKMVRYGGDEYIIILPWQGREAALSKVRRIKGGLSRTRFLKNEGIKEKISASFGIATFPADASDKEDLLRQADHYMYQSKDSGKNRITAGASLGALSASV